MVKKRLVKIVISRGLVPGPTQYKAELNGATGLCGYGSTSSEAVGDFVRYHGYRLGLELEYAHQELKVS